MYAILEDPPLFSGLPGRLQNGLLDVLYLMCRGGIYDIARLRYYGEWAVKARGDDSRSRDLPSLLLRLLAKSVDIADIVVSKRLIRLFGSLSTAGISISDLKAFLQLLKSVSPLSLSLLQSLKVMMTQDDKVSKASPGSFFNFGGTGAGLIIDSNSFPFTREYHILFWFRVDAVRREGDHVQHLVTMTSESFLGLDIFVSGKTLHIGIRPTKSDNLIDLALSKKNLVSGVWYRLSVQHAKPRLNLLGFSKDSLTVHLDNELIYQEHCPFPNASQMTILHEFIIGKDLNGQMGPVFLFSELLPMSIAEYIFRVTAGKSADGVNAIDLVQSITLSDKTKVVNMFTKLASGFHPSRWLNNRIVDISGGRHGRLGPLTQSWNVEAPRDVLVSLGGINCILPLFPRLIVENEYAKSNVRNPSCIDIDTAKNCTPVTYGHTGQMLSNPVCTRRSNLGTSLSELCHDIHVNPILCRTLRADIEMLSVEYSDSGSISLLFTILARCLRLHPTNQRDIVRLKAIEMIEYALFCVPTYVLQDESEGCVRAILELQTAVQDFPAIDVTIMRHILCNFKVWCRTQFQYQSSLMGVVLALIRAQPERYLHIMGVEWLLDCMYSCYADRLDVIVDDDSEAALAMENSVSVQTIENEIFLDSTDPIDQDKPEFPTLGASNDQFAAEAKAILNSSSSSILNSSSSSILNITSPIDPKPPQSLQVRRKSGVALSTDISNYSSAPNQAYLNGLCGESDIFEDSLSGSTLQPVSELPRVNSTAKMMGRKNINGVRGSFYRSVSMRVASFAVPVGTDFASDSNSVEPVPEDRGARMPEGMCHSFESDDFETEVVARLESGDSLRLQSTVDHALTVSAGTESFEFEDDRNQCNDHEMDSPEVAIVSFEDSSQKSRRTSGILERSQSRSPIPALAHSYGVTPTPNAEVSSLVENEEGEEVINVLTSDERMHLRGCMQTMLMALIQQGSSAKELIPVLNFISYCKDLVVLNEISHLLLCSIVEGDSKLMVAITEASHGPEEFAGFVITRLVNQPVEQLRCTGIRLLTHYYLRINAMPAYALNLRLRRKTGQLIGRTGKLSRARDSFMHTSDQVGLNRLEACGGLAQVWKCLDKYTDEATELTYSALLEMLLTTSAISSQISVQSKHYFEDISRGSSTSASGSFRGGVTALSGGLMQTPVKANQSFGIGEQSHEHGSSITQRSVIFAPNSSNPQSIADHEENQLCTFNPCVLSLFCHFLPQFSMAVHERIYMDLFGLLKNNSKNLDVFYSHPSWNLCMYDLVSQLIVVTSVCTSTVQSVDLCAILEGWALLENYQAINSPADGRCSPLPTSVSPKRTAPHGKLLRQWQRSASFRDSEDGNVSVRIRSVSETKDPSKLESSKGDIEVWFDIAVKIYATVLLYGLDTKGGWKDIQQTIALSYDSIHGTAVTYAVFSHLMNEMTFKMRSKYKEINKMAQSSKPEDNIDATTKLENMLAYLLLTSEFLLETQPGHGEMENSPVRQDNITSLRATSTDDDHQHHAVGTVHYPRFVGDEVKTPKRHVSNIYETESDHTFGTKDSYPMGLLESLETQSFAVDTDDRPRYMESTTYQSMSSNISVLNIASPLNIYCTKRQPSQDERVMSSVFETGGGISSGMHSFSQTASFIDAVPSSVNSSNQTASEVVEAADVDDDLFDGSDNAIEVTGDLTNEHLTPEPSEAATPKESPHKANPVRSHRRKHQHKWIDLRINAGYPPQTDGIDGLFARRHGDSPPGKDCGIDTSADYNKRVNTREVLGPLGRGFEFPKGKMILVLQTLRFFDLIFWPTEHKIRNSHLLNFDRTVVEGMVSSTYSESSSTPATELTIHSAGVRLCLFVLSALSPFSEMAELNIRRLRAIIRVPPISPLSAHLSTENTDNMPSCAGGPTIDCCICAGGMDQPRPLSQHWMLVILAYAVKTLQRLNAALHPVYIMIGISSGVIGESSLGFLPNFQRSTGHTDDSSPPRSTASVPSVDQEDNDFERILMDSAVIQDVDALFNTLTGRRLVQYISSIVGLVVDMYEIGKNVFAETLGEEEFFKYTLLVQRHQNTQLKLANFIKQRTADDRLSDPLSHLDLQKQSQNNKKDPAIFRRHRSQTQTFEYFIMQQMNSEKAETASQPPASPLTRSNRSSSMPLSSVVENGACEISSPASVRQTEEDFGRDVIALLRWLRDPFLQMDVMHNACIIGSISTIEMCEMNWTTNFLAELLSTRNLSEQQRQVDRKVADEAKELQELSVDVTNAIINREDSRLRDMQSLDQVKMKSSAAGWFKCMKMFEASWSPWSEQPSSNATEEKYDKLIGPIEQNTISTHRDGYKRRMLTIRSAEPIDHSKAAYLDGKQRDQKAYEAGIDLVRGDNISYVSNEPKNFHGMLKRFQVPSTTLSSAANQLGTVTTTDSSKALTTRSNAVAAWGDDDSDDDETGVSEAAGEGAATGARMLFSSASAEPKPLWSLMFRWRSDERVVFKEQALLIRTENTLQGTLLLTNYHIYFHPKRVVGGLNVKNASMMDERWRLDQLNEAFARRYLLQNCAIELFFARNFEIFFAFKSLASLKRFFRYLRRQSTPLLTSLGSLDPRQVFNNTNWTELWRKRQITNFEYLMRLNVISGRSYNDITQYPVFPWIIKDYVSEILDLENPEVFRDLSKPVGALNNERLADILERYRSLDDDLGIPKFMYGSHYSSAGVILHYLVRQEPFTSLNISLQGGRLDCPDRLFFNVKYSWDGCNRSMSDVKELIPEFFCFPEFLINSNNVPLGELQDDLGVVDDVVLPKWAQTPFDFVQKNREALESDYVSEHLHEWIDLVFGSKQTGQAAIDAHNVFYYLTYENAIQLDKIEDPLQREAAKSQVIHFGQTPTQLLTKEHPRRLPKEECILPLFSCIKSDFVSRIQLIKIPILRTSAISGPGTSPVISMKSNGDKIISILADFTVISYSWLAYPSGVSTPFQLRVDKVKSLPSLHLSISRGLQGGAHDQQHTAEGIDMSSRRNSTGSSIELSDNNVDSPGFFSGRKSLFGGLLGRTRTSTGAPASRPLSIPSGFKSERELIPAIFTSGTAMSDESKIDVSEELADQLVHLEHDVQRKKMSHVNAVDQIYSDDRPVLGPWNVGISMLESGYSRICSCCYWDSTLKVHTAENLKEMASTTGGHFGRITCVEVGKDDNRIFITGGADGTCRMWVLENFAFAQALAQEEKSYTFEDDALDPNVLACVHVFWGHDSAVCALAYSSHHDIILSGSAGGTVCLHEVSSGNFIRSLYHFRGHRIESLLITMHGYIIIHTERSLALFWINGELLHEIEQHKK